MMENYGILEIAKTGVLAMSRGENVIKYFKYFNNIELKER